MKKLLLFGVFLSFGAVSCRTTCPAYTSIEPTLPQSAPVAAVLASTATTVSQP